MVTVKRSTRNQPLSPPQEFSDWLPFLTQEENEEATVALKKLLAWFDSGAADVRPELRPNAWEVSTLLVQIRMDHETICATLCRNLLNLKQNDETQFAQIDQLLGASIGRLLRGLTRIGEVTRLHDEVEEVEKNAQAEIIREMLFAVTDDVRVVLVTLVEQLCLLRAMVASESDDRQRVARRVNDIFAPIANLLGIWQLKWELEDLSFRLLKPQEYRRIAQSLAEKRIDRELYINEVISLLKNKLRESGIEADVVGRPKHIVSIWRKMQRKQVEFNEVYDIRAVRVLVNTIPECYTVLGIVHSLWPHIKNEFDDYIAVPKGNNYQSLHTAVIGPQGKPVEIQVRTHAMDRHSELGVAAHWRYKDGTVYGAEFLKKVTRLRHYLEQNRDDQSPGDILRQFSTDTLDQRVYAVTPKGKIIDLPKGSTPLDFAYHIHSEVGHHCRGAKVNGRIVPLTYPLKSGDRVDILVHPSGRPSTDWLNVTRGFVVTGRARSRIRAWFREQNFESHVQDGRQIVERELRGLHLSEEDFNTFVSRSRFQSANEYYAAVGRGDLLSDQVADSLHSYLNERTAQADRSADKLVEIVNDVRPVDTRLSSDITIEGVGQLLTQMAKCCQPTPFDPIIGFITQGRGVTIHRQDCPNVKALREEEPQRMIDVDWANKTRDLYQAGLTIEAYDRRGLLSDITSLLAREKVNVLNLNTQVDPQDRIARIRLLVEIVDNEQLRVLIDKLANQSGVICVRREGGGM